MQSKVNVLGTFCSDEMGGGSTPAYYTMATASERFDSLRKKLTAAAIADTDERRSLGARWVGVHCAQLGKFGSTHACHPDVEPHYICTMGLKIVYACALF